MLFRSQNWDFRPKENSPLVEGGKEVNKSEIKSLFVNFYHLPFQGKTPDIGAYEYGEPSYWIPGRQLSNASTPIPLNKGGNIALDQDLMYLGAYKAKAHYIYFGDSPESLSLKEQHLDQNNIFDPGDLSPNKEYFWRVDAYVNGKLITGDLWSFKTRK